VRDLDELWRFVLRRPIEAEERAATEARIADGMSYASLVQELATSPEFEHLKRLEDAVAWAAAQRRAGERPRTLEAPLRGRPRDGILEPLQVLELR